MAPIGAVIDHRVSSEAKICYIPDLNKDIYGPPPRINFTTGLRLSTCRGERKDFLRLLLVPTSALRSLAIA